MFIDVKSHGNIRHEIMATVDLLTSLLKNVCMQQTMYSVPNTAIEIDSSR